MNALSQSVFDDPIPLDYDQPPDPPPEPSRRSKLSGPSEPPGQYAHQTDMAPRVATTITIVVLLGFFAVALSYVHPSSYSPAGLAGCAGILAVTCLLQLSHSFPRLMWRLAPYRTWTLALQTLLTFAPFAFFHAAWLGMPGLLGASVLLVLPRHLGRLAFAGSTALTGLLQSTVGYGYQQLAYSLVSTCLTGVVLYGLSRLTDLVREVQTARGELTRMAVAKERLRFARDLHDLLGYSLSTITLKSELTLRLLEPQPERAEQEVLEILQTARRALSDVRSVAAGYCWIKLAPELTAAESMLDDVGIRTTVRRAKDPLPPVADTVLATVLREGITNMLRHSRARSCVIDVSRQGQDIRLRIANDGVGAASTLLATGDQGQAGSGLGNLTARVEVLGGRLDAGVRTDDGWFQLTATVPSRTPQGDYDGELPSLITASPIPARSGPRPHGYAR